MKKPTLALALLLALAGTASAQDMPDARQMSGTPRPDQEVPLGTVTVRLVRGEMFNLAPAGSLVHLVALRGDGSAEKITRPIDAQGRATFDKLAADGSVAYYAYALLGEDRLESSLIVLDKMAGIRLALAGRKLDPQGQPIGAPIDDASSPEDPMKQPPGEVWVALGGRGIGKGTPVELIEIAEKGAPAAPALTSTAVDGGNGQFVARFADVHGDASKLFLTRVKVGGRYFNSKPFMMSPGAGAGRRILVIDQVIVSMHMAGEVDDNMLRMQAQYILQNFQGSPPDPGPDGLVLPLPVGAIGGSTDDPSGKVKIDPGKRIIYRGLVPPGQTEIIIAFGMPVDDGTAQVELAAPFGLYQSMVVVSVYPRSSITAIDVQVPKGARAVPPIPMVEKETEDGRKFYVGQNVTMPASSVMRFTVSGLPQRPRSEVMARNLAGVLVLLLVIAAVLVAVFNPFKQRARSDAAGVTTPGEGGVRERAARRKELTSRREQLYEELVALERRRASQQIDDDRYEMNRQAVVSRLTMVLRELDQLDAGGTRAS